MLTLEQKTFYQAHGYLHVKGLITPHEQQELSEELEWIFSTWANHDAAWQGPWREKYMSETESSAATLIAMNDMHLFSDQWNRMTGDPRIVGCIADLIGPDVELHHTTLHAKPPETGSPFPLHQDNAFFAHAQASYVDAILHIDAAPEEAGCLRFIPGSHKQGPLPHIRNGGAPHLSPDEVQFSDTVAVPAEAGDVIFFSLWTIHGSDLNRTNLWRRVVRIGYRDPANPQIDGHALGRLGWMVQGRRQKGEAALAMAR
jgi:phytanoyl-CoA hydroxylase